MSRMTGPDCAVMCNLISTHTYYILHSITFVTAGIRDRPVSDSGIFMGFMGVRIRTKGRK